MRREIIAFLKEKINPDFIILFGSYAKGYARPDSDVDIAFTKKAVYWHPMNVFYLPRNLQID
ncbi:nucleotidyltransferase domain-containing protein [Heyndrickxia coagulans]|uniref:nucleotidyltransferase family protein n=1 Tax=Heyndrickxia coagulans TaxID=1398 RepID=UPI0028F9984A|nr:nucleotidyltransferase domain-containing protein [Heyndrickxia coagulans]MDT9757069.1 nucleotidyltransferase domain-containing protein [Heyndrickxia coagulans]